MANHNGRNAVTHLPILEPDAYPDLLPTYAKLAKRLQALPNDRIYVIILTKVSHDYALLSIEEKGRLEVCSA